MDQCPICHEDALDVAECFDEGEWENPYSYPWDAICLNCGATGEGRTEAEAIKNVRFISSYLH